jgi:hypothetical protein
MREGGYRKPPKWRSHGLAARRFASAAGRTLTWARWRVTRRAPVQLRHNMRDRSRAPDGDLSPCPRRVLVAVPLVAHTLALERLILSRRNFQFLVSKVAPDPVPKHLDILLRRCSNSTLRTHGSFQVRTAPLDCSGKVMVNCCPKSRRNDAQSVHREWLPHAFPRASTRHTSVNIER